MADETGSNPQGTPNLDSAAQEAARFMASQSDQGRTPQSETPQPEGQADVFEILHEGQKRQFTKDELITLAQKGYDYTQKTQKLALLRNMTPQQVEELGQQAAALRQLQDFARVNPDFVEYMNSYKPGWRGISTVQAPSQGHGSPEIQMLQQELWQLKAQNTEKQLDEAMAALPRKIADRFKKEGVEIAVEELAKEMRPDEILETAYHYKLPLDKIEDAFFIRYGPKIAQRAISGYLKAKTAQSGPKVPGGGGTPATKTHEIETFDQADKAARAFLKSAEEHENY